MEQITQKIDEDIIEVTESESKTFKVSIKSIEQEIVTLERQLQEKKDFLTKLKNTK